MKKNILEYIKIWLYKICHCKTKTYDIILIITAIIITIIIIWGLFALLRLVR